MPTGLGSTGAKLGSTFILGGGSPALPTATDQLTGDVAVGSNAGYIEVVHADTSFVRMIPAVDMDGNTYQYVMGLDYAKSGPLAGQLFAAQAHAEDEDGCPNDVAWIPNANPPAVLAAIVPSDGVLELRKYNAETGAQIGSAWTGLDTEIGWTRVPVKLVVACDGKRVFYTMQGANIFQYDLQSSSQLPVFDTLPVGSPYIYGDIDFLPPDIIVAMTLTGDGPRRGVALGSKTTVWTDEVNPTGAYHVYKRLTADGTLAPGPNTVLTKSDPASDNGPTLSLAAFFNPCLARRVGYAWVVS
jgi:hypothetical protein